SQTTYVAANCLKLNLGNAMSFKNIPGETFTKDGFSAFAPDEEALTDIIIDTFYQETKTNSAKSK
ncbi:MAG: hypothetical protein J5662_02455, partial [Clostridia bacterium]|nr:hypothetical protein [Clostridia bacterium]